jgi:uncharacterized protein with NAD-binding domain and iron-sulfur cluster
MTEVDRIRVAVVGGGCGALAAAFELTRPEQKGRFAVTVYQLGWRLGGKGASGRGGPRKRIEEHALHVWLGFYENAFRMLREAHAELGHPDRWREDFIQDSFIALARDALKSDGSVAAGMPAAAWATLFPPVPGLPGDPLIGETNPFAVASYLRQAIRLLRSLMSGLAYLEHDPERGFVDKDDQDLDPGPTPDDQPTAVRRALEATVGLLKVGVLSSSAGILTSLNLIEKLVLDFAKRARAQRAAEGHGQDDGDDYVVEQFVVSFANTVRKQLSGVVQAEPKFALRWQIVDLVLAILVGVVRDGLLTHPDGLDSINDEECRGWLRRHGASEASVGGAFVNGLYHLGFANKAGVAAGQALRGALRMFFTYRGAMFWKMRAGMGDVVFAPLYEVLKRRGVRFEFFHRLENVGMTFPTDGQAAPFVSSLEFDVQAFVPEAADFSPLEEVKGRACWMSQPPSQVATAGLDKDKIAFESFFDRRKVGTRTLQVGEEFDAVVLGIGKGGLRYVCREILDHPGAVGLRWKAMDANVLTVSTQSFQVWLRRDMVSLGWHGQSVTLTGIPGEFDTWADMRQVIPAEDWPPDATPRTAAYFCGPLAPEEDDTPNPARLHLLDPLYPGKRLEQVRGNAAEFLNTRMVHLWRGSAAAGEFDWRLLVDDGDPERLSLSAEQAKSAVYASANINPSDQYVLATPGSIEYRISPLDTGIANLTVAGDWTACGFTEGCVEAAVMSGKLASHAISGLPRLEDIVGYDHP